MIDRKIMNYDLCEFNNRYSGMLSSPGLYSSQLNSTEESSRQCCVLVQAIERMRALPLCSSSLRQSHASQQIIEAGVRAQRIRYRFHLEKSH